MPVTGQVLLDGKPAAAAPPRTGSVNFHPDSAKGNTGKSIGAGSINESGQYTLSYDGKPGVPAGWYKVTVTYSEPTDPKDPYSLPKRLINEKYVTKEFTDLSIEVKPDAGPGHYDIKVTR